MMMVKLMNTLMTMIKMMKMMSPISRRKKSTRVESFMVVAHHWWATSTQVARLYFCLGHDVDDEQEKTMMMMMTRLVLMVMVMAMVTAA